MIDFPVLNRWSGKVQFVASIECGEDAPLSIKAGLALQWGRSNDADLSGAVLRGAVLRGAVLSDAVLSDAVLRGAVLRDAVLRDAVLRDADLSDADLSGAVLRGAVLRDADLSGADLSGAVLRGAVLRGADLRGAVLRDAVLRGAVLRGADLSGADLRGAVLRDAVLRGAVLSGAVLSENLKGVPVVPNIDAAILEVIESGTGKLDMKAWHTCETTHCRAGWAITLAGAGGAALEFALGAAAAGALIYAASRPGKPIPDFCASNEAALEDMRAAAAEAAKAIEP